MGFKLDGTIESIQRNAKELVLQGINGLNEKGNDDTKKHFDQIRRNVENMSGTFSDEPWTEQYEGGVVDSFQATINVERPPTEEEIDETSILVKRISLQQPLLSPEVRQG